LLTEEYCNNVIREILQLEFFEGYRDKITIVHDKYDGESDIFRHFSHYIERSRKSDGIVHDRRMFLMRDTYSFVEKHLPETFNHLIERYKPIEEMFGCDLNEETLFVLTALHEFCHFYQSILFDKAEKSDKRKFFNRTNENMVNMTFDLDYLKKNPMMTYYLKSSEVHADLFAFQNFKKIWEKCGLEKQE
jgi:hypothetical protein